VIIHECIDIYTMNDISLNVLVGGLEDHFSQREWDVSVG
jgi:hypothetical protein